MGGLMAGDRLLIPSHDLPALSGHLGQGTALSHESQHLFQFLPKPSSRPDSAIIKKGGWGNHFQTCSTLSQRLLMTDSLSWAEWSSINDWLLMTSSYLIDTVLWKNISWYQRFIIYNPTGSWSLKETPAETAGVGEFVSASRIILARSFMWIDLSTMNASENWPNTSAAAHSPVHIPV